LTVVAVVVTYNRADLLRRCLHALERQTHPLDEILVIDNASTDGTPDMVRREFPAVSLTRMTRNSGGAGGFARGVDMAIDRGHEFAWLFDDDAEPRHEALAPLMAAMHTATPTRPGFVAATVVGPEGEILDAHLPPRIENSRNLGIRCPDSTYPAAFATFVGPLINLQVAQMTYLPIADFYIWWDDWEYTARLQSLSGGLASPESLVAHPARPDDCDKKWRLRADIRNRLWIIRLAGLASSHARSYAEYRFWGMMGDQARLAESKTRWAYYVVVGLVEGLLTKPRLVMPSRAAESANQDRPPH